MSDSKIVQSDVLRGAVLSIAPAAKMRWLDALLSECEKARDISRLQQCALWANVVHETGGMTTFEESLAYSASRLLVVWPRIFRSLEDARPYERSPEALANRVYRGRLGNVDPGDGWRYRGRGHIMLTGRALYRECGAALGEPLESDPDRLLDPEVSARAAVWWWRSRRLGEAADQGLIADVRRRWSGSAIGLSEVQRLYRRLLELTGA